MKKNTQSTIFVELHVPDFKLAKDFYGKLGFTVAREVEPDEEKGYLVLKKDNNILCFWAGNEYIYKQNYFKKFPKDTKRGYGVEIVIMVENIDELYDQAKLFANIVRELQLRPWGARDFRLEDPFGFYIRFTEPYNVLK
jgi:predicted lactoylglutathione lyase